jgi:hypothetical protein
MRQLIMKNLKLNLRNKIQKVKIMISQDIFRHQNKIEFSIKIELF